MYKSTARSLRRKTRVHLVDYEPQAHVGSESDFIGSPANMSMADCLEEKTKLLTEKTRTENERANSHGLRYEELGRQILGFCTRISMLNTRIKDLNRQQSQSDLKAAMEELLDFETIGRILNRASAIRIDREKQSTPSLASDDNL